MNVIARLSAIGSAALLLLAGCSNAAVTQDQYYARIRYDDSKGIALTVEGAQYDLDELNVRVFDYVEKGEKILTLKAISAENIDELREKAKLYKNYMNQAQLIQETAELNIEYYQAKYEELTDLYGTDLTESQKLELKRIQNQIELYMMEKEAEESTFALYENNYNNVMKSLEKNEDYAEEYFSPQSGYLVNLILKPDDSMTNFQVGTLISTEDIALEVQVDPALYQKDQEVQVKIGGEWITMYVFEIIDKVLLKSDDINITKHIQFNNPLIVELSGEPVP